MATPDHQLGLKITPAMKNSNKTSTKEAIKKGIKTIEKIVSHKEKKPQHASKGDHKTTPHVRLRTADPKRVEYRDGVMEQKELPGVMSAWDAMCIQKCDPGSANVAYVAGMNVT